MLATPFGAQDPTPRKFWTFGGLWKLREFQKPRKIIGTNGRRPRGLPATSAQGRRARPWADVANFQDFRGVGPCDPRRVDRMGIPGAAEGGSGGFRLVASRARIRGLTACVAQFSGVGNRPPRCLWAPPLFFGDFRNSRNFRNPPNFQKLRGVGPCAPKRVARMATPGVAGVGSGGF